MSVSLSGKTLRVAFVIQTFHPVVGGAEKQLEALLPKIQQQNITARVFTRGIRNCPNYQQKKGIEIIRSGSNRFGFLGSALFYICTLWHLYRFKPDVVSAFSLMTPAFIGIAYKIFTGTPLIVKILRGGLRGDLDRIRNKRFFYLRQRLLTRYVDAVQVISDEIADECIELGFYSDQLMRIANGVDTEHLLQPQSAAEVRRRFSIPADAVVFLFVGRLVSEKNVIGLISAFSQVNTANEACWLIIVGDGPEREHLAQLASRLQNVVFAGSTEDIRPYLHAANIYVQSSTTEGMSNSLLEAMAVGLRIVATRVGATQQLLGSESSDMLVDPNDSKMLASAMIKQLKIPHLSASDKLSRARTLTAYNLDAIADQLVQVYFSLPHSSR